MLPAIMAGLTVAPKVIEFVRGLKSKGAVDSVLELAESLTGKKGSSAIEAINQDPNLALQFEQSVLTHKAELLEIELRETQAYLADRQDSRARDIALRNTGYSNWRADVLAVGALVGLVALIWTLLFVSLTEGPARDVLLVLSGALVAIVKDVYQFEFGSSRGSKDKDTKKESDHA